jgi:large subunit ribosomal protein L6
MSRIGKVPVSVPSGVEVTIDANKLSVKGPKGQLSREFSGLVKLAKQENTIAVKPAMDVKPSQVTKEVRAMWGLSRQLVNNMVEGVSKGFSKNIVITGNGYRASIVAGMLQLSLGYSHDILMEIPTGIEVKCDKNIISISGNDKELVGLFSSQVRGKRPTEPYKGKGLEYEGVVIIKKASKKK